MGRDEISSQVYQNYRENLEGALDGLQAMLKQVNESNKPPPPPPREIGRVEQERNFALINSVLAAVVAVAPIILEVAGPVGAIVDKIPNEIRADCENRPRGVIDKTDRNDNEISRDYSSEKEELRDEEKQEEEFPSCSLRRK